MARKTDPFRNRDLWKYARGFLLTDTDIEPPVSLWAKARAGKYYLSYDPRCEFALSRNDDRWMAILGLAMNTRNWSMDIETVAKDALAALSESETKFFDFVDDLSGRFIIIYHHNDKTSLMADATGMRSIFYADCPHTLVVSSHATLIREITGAGPSPAVDISWLDRYTNYCLPGHLTPYDGVYYLTPNTLLELETREVVRFFPREELPERQVEDIVDELSELFNGQMELIAEKLNPAISLSAGLDSRTTLAMSKNIVDRALFFSYIVENDPHHDFRTLEIDRRVACEIADNVGLRHMVVRVSGDNDSHNLSPIQRGNSFLTHSHALARAYAEEIGGDYIHVRSNLSEIGQGVRAVWSSRYGPMKPEVMAMTYCQKSEAEYDKKAVEAFAAFQEKTQFDRIYNYDDYDIWYWEHRMGTWHPCVLLESDVAFDTFSPYNCRRLLKLLLSPPFIDRCYRSLNLELIERNWPNLLFWPRNKIRKPAPMYSWHREPEFLSLEDAKIEAGSLNDPNAEVSVFGKAVDEEIIIQHERSDPKKGDYVAARLTLNHEPDQGYGLHFNITSLYHNHQCRGYMAYQILLDGEILLEEDIALWRQPNSIQINWVPDKEKSILEARIVALRDCEPWQWNRASRTIWRDVSLAPIEHSGDMEIKFTSPYTEPAGKEGLISRLARLLR